MNLAQWYLGLTIGWKITFVATIVLCFLIVVGGSAWMFSSLTDVTDQAGKIDKAQQAENNGLLFDEIQQLKKLVTGLQRKTQDSVGSRLFRGALAAPGIIKATADIYEYGKGKYNDSDLSGQEGQEQKENKPPHNQDKATGEPAQTKNPAVKGQVRSHSKIPPKGKVTTQHKASTKLRSRPVSKHVALPTTNPSTAAPRTSPPQNTLGESAPGIEYPWENFDWLKPVPLPDTPPSIGLQNQDFTPAGDYNYGKPAGNFTIPPGNNAFSVMNNQSLPSGSNIPAIGPGYDGLGGYDMGTIEGGFKQTASPMEAAGAGLLGLGILAKTVMRRGILKT